MANASNHFKDLGFPPGHKGRRAGKGMYHIFSKEKHGVQHVPDDVTSPIGQGFLSA